MSYQWSQLTRVIVVSISLILTAAVLYAIRPLLGPIVLSFLFAYMLLPAVRQLHQRTRLTYRLSVVTVYFSVLLLLLAAMSTLVPVLIRQFVAAPNHLAIVSAELDLLFAEPVLILGRSFDFSNLWRDLADFSPEEISTATGNALIVLETTSLSFAWLLIILVTTFYLLLDWDRLFTWLISQAPVYERADFIRLLREIDAIWRAYIRGMLQLALIVSILFFFILAFVGLPSALMMALLTGLLVTIPEVGPVISSLIAIVVALVQGSDFLTISNFWFAVLVGVIYFVIMQFLIIWLQPRIVGSHMKMNTGLVFVALVGAILLQGVLTAFIIVPLLATLGVLGRYMRCKLLNLDPWPEETQTAAARATTPKTDNSDVSLEPVIND